jgi:hypothetical protein
VDVGANCMCIPEGVFILRGQGCKQKQLSHWGEFRSHPIWAHLHHKKYEAFVTKNSVEVASPPIKHCQMECIHQLAEAF